MVDYLGMKTFTLMLVLFTCSFGCLAQSATAPQVAISRMQPITCALLSSYVKIACTPMMIAMATSPEKAAYVAFTLTYKDSTGAVQTVSAVSPAISAGGTTVGIATFDDPGGTVYLTATTLLTSQTGSAGTPITQ
jgi:hypothetical protein